MAVWLLLRSFSAALTFYNRFSRLLHNIESLKLLINISSWSIFKYITSMAVWLLLADFWPLLQVMLSALTKKRQLVLHIKISIIVELFRYKTSIAVGLLLRAFLSLLMYVIILVYLSIYLKMPQGGFLKWIVVVNTMSAN